MSKALIITVAGTSSRFRKSLGKDVLKAIYSEDEKPSILDTLLEYSKDSFEEIVIVGGYKHKELQIHIEKQYHDSNITLVYNKQYERGSNESLLCGIRALSGEYSEILFAEGDLVIDKESFLSIVDSKLDVITNTTIPIEAKTSVIYYFNVNNELNYKYDTEHKSLYVDEPFISISNSGQIWKFCDVSLLKGIANSFTDKDIDGTNLLTVSQYFNSINYDKIEQIQIQKWFNCNTIEDYRIASEYLKKEQQ
jgi:NDP-sugar pyrophosphorylase family protein